MSPLWIGALVALAAAALGWRLRRRATARRDACRRQLAELLAELRPGVSLTEAEHGRWRLQPGGGEPAMVDAGALTRAAADDDGRRRLFLAVADAAAAGPRPFAGEFDLKSHGGRTLPRLADEGLPLLALEPPAARFTATDSAGLPTIYLVDGEPRPAYVTDEHLAGAGIDARDLHGVALAVMRQLLDESEIRAALVTGEAVALEPPDGCGGSRLLLLPEALRGDETLFACAPSPALLLVAADRGALDRALAGRPEPSHPLPPAVFEATAAGVRMES